jgi:hypothetical protein
MLSPYFAFSSIFNYDGGYVIMENNAELEVSQGRRKDFLDAIQDFVV